MKRRIGLLGGSFNPAHAGHLHLSLAALKALRLDEIWWLVSPANPLKAHGDLAEYDLRVASAERLTAYTHRIRVSRFEQERGLRYTVDTIAALQQRFPRHDFVWLMGADNLAQFHRWKAWERIARSLPIAVFDRAPYTLNAVVARFARRYSHSQRKERTAQLLPGSTLPAWVYIHMKRHPLSASFLRKTLGTAAFHAHSVPENAIQRSRP